jgi:hypothetical protein
MAVFWDASPYSLVYIDVSKELNAPVITTMSISTRLHGVTSQKTAIFILVTLRTSSINGNNNLKPVNHVGLM